MAGAFLSASLQVLLERMASREVLAFLRGQKPVGDKLVRKLKMKLLAVHAVLDDAEAKQFRKPSVKIWLDDLNDVVYDAEDLLDEITTEALRCKMEYSGADQTGVTEVRDIISASLYPFSERIESRIEEITDKLENLSQEKDVLGLKIDVGEKLSKRRPTTSLVDESKVCGREGDMKEIVEYLLSHNVSGSRMGVMALVGMGGIGKTTLTQLIYNDKKVTECFDLKAWVCVSDEFDLVRITKAILKAIDSGTFGDDDDLNLLQVKLKERLYRKKFLVVLDDVWNEDYDDWDLLQKPFSVGLNGSKILVTTRSDKVASVMRSVRNHHLGQLSFEDCWSLFAKHAFENGDSSLYPELEEIGKEIVKKCKGLPLAVKTLGGALYSELRVKEWKNLLNSETWDLPNAEILPALRLSYSFLPSHLKRCFAYCSIFPKDYIFEKENLILLWMAQGFLQQSEGKKTMEEVGDGYFDDLLSRSFFQKSSSHKSFFVMHDLINDLAQLVSGKFCVQLKDGNMHETYEKLRHVSYFISEYDHFKRLETHNEVNCLRTFLPLNLMTWPRNDKVSKKRVPSLSRYSSEFFLSNRVWSDLLFKVPYLRVLSLRTYGITSLPNSIGNLKHLRYLDLTRTRIKLLPESLCTLYNLQTLILYHCYFLTELPKNMCKTLINLRHLDIRRSGVKEMSCKMDTLKSLQKLSNYRVGKQSGTKIAELRELCHIGGSLGIHELQNVVNAKDALEANLVGMQYLDELELEWNPFGDVGGQPDMVLNNLQPHSNLKRLTINRYIGSRFPNWIRDPSILVNMVTLRLWDCTNVSAFPPFGQLPSLKHLYIWELSGIERVGAEFYGTDSSSSRPSFPSLKSLSFMSMHNWKEWLCLGLGDQDGGFPVLKELYLVKCPKLVGALPNHLPFLTRLDIQQCEQLVAPLPRVPTIRTLTIPNREITEWKELPQLLRDLSIENSYSLGSLLEEGMLQSNTHLQGLTTRNCFFSRILCRVRLPTSLRSLHIQECKKLEFLLPEFFQCHLPFLNHLSIRSSSCDSLTFFQFPLGNFPRLSLFSIDYLEGLESLSVSNSDGDLTSLSSLVIARCPNLVSIELLALNLPEYHIFGCKKLKWLLHNAACFEWFELTDCPELIFPIQGLPSSLTSLSIASCDKLTSQMESGPQPLAFLTSIEIAGLPNLMSLDGMRLQLLTSLRKLTIYDCPKLQSLTEERLPNSLSLLIIHNCPLLKDRCRFWTGEDWPRISHIQGIVIDDQVL